MRTSVIAQQQLHQTIQSDIDKRIEDHQARIRSLRIAQQSVRAMGAAALAQPRPLVMLAHGDSWFDYPLAGNGVSLGDTDIIAQLRGMGTVNPLVLNMSHYGDATTDEMSLPKQQRMIEALNDPDNWLGAQPDAILFSGGGNDIAGNEFCIILDYAVAGSTGLNAQRFRAVLGMVEASYLDLFAFRDRYAPNVPIFGHDYDFAIPNGTHPICVGPWLQPSLRYAGWNDLAKGRAIVKDALQQFSTMLKNLASTPANKFTLVHTQGTLQDSDWANELHPFPDGFRKLAAQHVSVLRNHFPSRI